MPNARPPDLPSGKKPPALKGDDRDSISSYFWLICLLCCAIALSALFIFLIRFGGGGGTTTAEGTNGSSAAASAGNAQTADSQSRGSMENDESPANALATSSGSGDVQDAAAASVSEPTDVPAAPAEPSSDTSAEPSTENDADVTDDNATETKQEHGFVDGESTPSESDDEETKQTPKSRPEVGLFSEASAGFFGITVKAEKIAYVVDVSSSMGGWMMDANAMKLDRSKQELLQSIKKLNQGQRFTVVMFNDQASFDQRFDLAKPSRKCVAELEQALTATFPTGGTEPTQALMTVLQGDYDAIFLLSDGEFNPTTVAAIKQANTKHILINAICLGTDSATLQQIAKDSSGQYRSIH